MGAAPWIGRGDQGTADQAALDTMMAHLATLDIEGCPGDRGRREGHSVIVRSKTESIRYMDAHHDVAKLREIAAVVLD